MTGARAAARRRRPAARRGCGRAGQGPGDRRQRLVRGSPVRVLSTRPRRCAPPLHAQQAQAERRDAPAHPERHGIRAGAGARAGPELEPKLEPALRRTERSAAAKPSKGLGARGGPRRGSRRLRHATGDALGGGRRGSKRNLSARGTERLPGTPAVPAPAFPERVTGTRAPPGKCKEPEVSRLPEYQESILR